MWDILKTQVSTAAVKVDALGERERLRARTGGAAEVARVGRAHRAVDVAMEDERVDARAHSMGISGSAPVWHIVGLAVCVVADAALASPEDVARAWSRKGIRGEEGLDAEDDRPDRILVLPKLLLATRTVHRLRACGRGFG